jgi:hypothetical protein
LIEEVGSQDTARHAPFGRVERVQLSVGEFGAKPLHVRVRSPASVAVPRSAEGTGPAARSEQRGGISGVREEIGVRVDFLDGNTPRLYENCTLTPFLLS